MTGSRREQLLSIGLPVATAVVLAALWQAAVSLTDIREIMLPAPTAMVAKLNANLPTLLEAALVTGREALAAFALAVVAGFIVAAASSSSQLLRETIYPAIIALQLIPKVALAPLFVVILGIEAEARITFAALLSFFPVLISTASGLSNTDPNAMRLCRSLRASAWQSFWSVRVPFALPHFFYGMRISSTMAVTGVVIAEFISAKQGLGFAILSASAVSKTATVFAAIAVLCALGLGLYGAVAALERLAARWYRG
ncbi:MAG: ABC transporter permease [Proteobacteria bacterium]|nr:ABC transporter permease [Pseudomonadota bacterium]MBS0549807.1 ABC transporter permease [Pseudomonadota bacterium]